jgi:hypothetical protein
MTTATSREIVWQNAIAHLPWDPKRAEQSAKLAFAKAQWVGIGKAKAIQQIFELAMDGFFQEHPHIPYQVWHSVSEQIGCPDE